MASHKQLDTATEQVLVEKCRRQNYEAFGQLVDAYQSRVLGFVRGMVHNSEEALDITQEVFIKAFQAFGRFDGRSSLRTWLFRIAYNLCVDRSRKLGRSLEEFSVDAVGSDGESWEMPDQRLNPEEFILDAELIGHVHRGVEAMSDKLRTVLLLHDQEEMSYEEIASTVNVPIGTVKSRLFLARAFLQKYLAEYMKGSELV